MGLGGISIWQLLIVLAIIILLFGTKRLRSFGSDLGNAVKGFRKAMDDDGEKDKESKEQDKIPPQQSGDDNDNTASKTETKEEKR